MSGDHAACESGVCRHIRAFVAQTRGGVEDVEFVSMWESIIGSDDQAAPEVFAPDLHQYVAEMLHWKLYSSKLRELAVSVGTNQNENLWSMLIKFSHGKALNQSGTFSWYSFASLVGMAQNVGWPTTIVGVLEHSGLRDTLVARNARNTQADVASYLRKREREPESISRRAMARKRRKQFSHAAVRKDRASAYTESGKKMGKGERNKNKKRKRKAPVNPVVQKCPRCHRVLETNGPVHDCENTGPKTRLHIVDRDDANDAESLRLTRSLW